VVLSFLYHLVHRAFGALKLAKCDTFGKEAEILVLPHQLAVLRRQVGRARFTWSDRAQIVLLAGLIPLERWTAFLVTPQTISQRYERAFTEVANAIVTNAYTWRNGSRLRPEAGCLLPEDASPPNVAAHVGHCSERSAQRSWSRQSPSTMRYRGENHSRSKPSFLTSPRWTASQVPWSAYAGPDGQWPRAPGTTVGTPRLPGPRSQRLLPEYHRIPANVTAWGPATGDSALPSTTATAVLRNEFRCR